MENYSTLNILYGTNVSRHTVFSYGLPYNLENQARKIILNVDL